MHVVAELDLEARDDRDEVRVAAALAVAVQRALHLPRAGLDRGDASWPPRTRRRCACGCRARRRRRAPRARRPRPRPPAAGSVAPLVSHMVTFDAPASAAVRRQAARSRGRPRSRRRSARRRRRPPCPARRRTRTESPIIARFSSRRDAHDLVEVQVPGLADERDRRVRSSRPARAAPRRPRRATSLRRVMPKAADARALERLLLELLEQLPVLRVRCREAGLDVRAAEAVEQVRDLQLLADGQRDSLALHAVAQRRVVDVNRLGHRAPKGTRRRVR